MQDQDRFYDSLEAQGLPKPISEKLKGEGISHQHFSQLSSDVARALGFNGAALIAIVTAQATYDLTVPPPPAPDAVAVDQVDQGNDVDDDRAGDKAEDANVDEEILEQFQFIEALHIYFEAGALADLSFYELKSMHAQLRRWENATTLGLPLAEKVKPIFVKDYERGVPSARPRTTHALLGEGSRSSVRETRASTVTASSFNTNTVNLSENDGVEQHQTSPAVVQRAVLLPAQRSLMSSVNSAPLFDVKAILTTNLTTERGKDSLATLEKGQIVSEPDRKLVMRTLSKWLHNEYVKDPKEVTTQMKDALAQAFVKEFPIYSVPCDNENDRPWAAIYNKKQNTGWLLNCSRPIQKENRKRKIGTSDSASSSKRPDGMTGVSLSLTEIKSLGLVMPTMRNKMEISRGMRGSFEGRVTERKEKKSVAYFLEKYPHFGSFGGEMISEEFGRMFPESGNQFCKKILDILPKILKLKEKRPIDLKHKSDILRALMLLSQHLPHDIPLKSDDKNLINYTWAREEDLMLVISSNDDIADKVATRLIASHGSVQPYVILSKSTVDKKISSCFIVLDGKERELSMPSTEPTLKALDYLMQTYLVFNVQHPFGWRGTLHMIQHYFYGVKEYVTSRGSRSLVSPSQMSLWQKINDTQV